MPYFQAGGRLHRWGQRALPRVVVAATVVSAALVAAPAAPSRARAQVRSHVAHAPSVAPGAVTRLHSDEELNVVAARWAGAVAATVELRWMAGGVWSPWVASEGEPTEGPDGGSREDRGATATAPTWVGHGVHDVEARLAGPATVITGLEVHGIHAQVNASTAPGAAAADPAQPSIHPRTDWGHSESWEVHHDDCQNPEYAPTVRNAIVHHTDTGNSYAPADVPSLIAAIWQFHVFSNGWCDIGYNFLVDRFGGVWEGRAGGIDRAAVGAHAGGFNTGSTGVSLLGTYDAASVPSAMYASLVQVLAWKMALHHANPTGQLTVRAGSFSGSRYAEGTDVVLWTISGHRDVDQTGCPGGLAYSLLRGLRIDVQRVMAAANTREGPGGYWLVAADGGIFAFGDATFRGSTGAIRLNQPIVGMAPTVTGQGYWLVAADGGIFAFGDALFYGSTGALHLNQPIVGMAATPTGRGYWLVASDGGIFAFGDATFRGSTGAIHLNQPIVGMAADPATTGYWLVAADGGIFAFNADFYGSTGNVRLTQPIVGMTAQPGGDGYRFGAADGGVFSFGSAAFAGSATGGTAGRVRAMAATPDGAGYRLTGIDGVLYSFGSASFNGSTAALTLQSPIVGIAGVPAPTSAAPAPPPGGGTLPVPVPVP